MSSAEINEVFNSCFNSDISIMNGVSKLTSILNKMNQEDFKASICKCISKVLICGSKYSEMSRLIELVSNLLTCAEVIKRQNCDNLDESMFEIEPIFYILLKYILSFHNADSKDVRLIVCGIITKILTSLASDIKLEISLIEEITNIMLERFTDTSPNVRAKAAQALSRLQEPESNSCPIIEHYIKALECDSNVNVRKAVIQNLCITSLSLPVIVGRIFDKKPIIRLNAYERLRKSVPVKALKIDQRSKIVSAGLKETVDDVKLVFNQLIINHWFISCCNSELLNYVKLFDVDEDHQILTESFNFILMNIEDSILSRCYEQVKTWFSLIQNISTSDNDIDCEKIFTWCRFISNIIAQKIKPSIDSSISIPEISDICSVMEKFIPRIIDIRTNFNEDKDDFNENIFIFKELLNLLQSYSLNDEAGRKSALDLLARVLQLPKIDLSLIPSVIKCYIYFSTTPAKALDSIIEIISEIRQPINATQFNSEPLKQTIPTNITSSADKEKADENILSPSCSSNATEDSDILSLCLTIASEVLYVKNIDLTSPSAVSLLTSFILPLIQDSRSSIRLKAVQCLSIFCICVRQFAQKYLILLFHIVKLDCIEIRKIAISAIFDIYIIYGTEIRSDTLDDSLETSQNTMNVEYLHKIIEDETDPDIVFIVVAGLCKLLLYQRNNSSLILSSLIVLYLNPEYEKEGKVKQVIGSFFRNYLQHGSPEHQSLLIPAFYMAVEQILICDVDSPLADIEFQHIINLLCNFILICSEKKEGNGENKLSFKENFIIYVLTKLSEFTGEIMFIRHCLRILCSLPTISNLPGGMLSVTDFIKILEEKLKECNDTRSLRYITKLKENISINPTDVI